MPTVLQVTSKLHIPALIDIRNEQFTEMYELGINWRLFGECEVDGPFDDQYLLESVKQLAHHHCFDGHHEQELKWLGFYLGMIHGGVLLPDGTLRQDATSLVVLSNEHFIHGYQVGRDFFFNEAEESERVLSDTDIIKDLRELVDEEPPSCQDTDDTWNYCIGCLLGKLSGHLFPYTEQERQIYEADRCYWEEQTRRQDTEPLPAIVVLQEA